MIKILTFTRNNKQFEIKSIKMKIQDLKKVRNEISHIGDIRKSVSNAEFPKMWKQAESAVLSLGGDAQAMENLRSAANISGNISTISFII